MKNSFFKPKNAAFLLAFFLFSSLFAQSPPVPCSVIFANCPGDLIPILDCDNSGGEALLIPSILANPSGNCSNFTLMQVAGPVGGSVVPIGIYFISFQATATDIGSGSLPAQTCTFSIEILKDLNPPVFTFCPPDVTVFGIDDGTGNCSAQVFWPTPTATDECGNPAISCSKPCGDLFPKGQTTVTCTATDASGNPVTCLFTVTVICTVGSSEAKNPEPSISLLPNPTSGQIALEWPNFLIEKGQLEIVSSLGQTVRKRQIPEGSARIDFEIADLPEGIYFVKITSKGQFLKALKFVKQ